MKLLQCNYRHLAIYLVCLAFAFPTICSSQYSIKSYADVSYNQCEPISYRLELEKAAAIDYTDIQLLIEFSDNIIYQENSLGLVLEQSSKNTLLFNLNDVRTCDFLTGNIIVIPDCPETIINLEAKFKLQNGQDYLAEAINLTVVKIPFVDVNLGEYQFDLDKDQLIKEFNIKNIGRSDISDIEIYPEISGDFISPASVNIGSLIDGKIIIDTEDLTLAGYTSGVLAIQESITLEIVYDINQCALNEVRYHISFPCTETTCDVEVLVVDENINYENAIVGTTETNTFYYGLCEFESNTFTIKNVSNEENSNLGDLYDLQYIIRSENINRGTINDCFGSEAFVGSSQVNIIADDLELILDFSSLTVDPDGPGGLEDLDDDGIYNDLRSGDSIDIEFGLAVKQNCAQNYHSQGYSINFSTKTRNICGATVNISDTQFNVAFANNLSGYISTIDFYQDGANLRYLEEGDELDLRYSINYSENIDRICDSEMILFEVTVPSTTVLNEAKDIYHFNGSDTVLLTPKNIQGATMTFEFPQLDSTGSIIVIPFTAVCLLEENTNYDANKDLCEQCLEYDLPRFRTSLSKPCPELDCSVPFRFPNLISASFYTSCDNIPEVKNGLVVQEPEFYRLPSGFLDESNTIRKNPLENPSDINNRTYFDHDTMLVRIPFEFDCPGSEENFQLNLDLGSMSNLEVEPLAASLKRVSPANLSDTIQCDVFSHVSLSGRILSFDVTASTYPGDCVMQGSMHWLEIKVLMKYTCELGRNCGLASRNTVSLSMQEVYNGTCTRTKRISRDSIYINELYKETFGGHRVSFPIQTSIYDEFNLNLSLYNTLTVTNSEPIEYRPLPIIREITYTFPVGYEPITELEIVSDKNAVTQFGFFDQEQVTLKSLAPSIKQNMDGTVSYTYSDPTTDYYINNLTRSIHTNFRIKNICEPIFDFINIHVEASIEYVDYANGSLETRTHNYEEDIPIQFLRKSFSPVDDFQIKTSPMKLDWEILNNAPPSFSGFFDQNNGKSDDEINFLVIYKSNGSQVDSLQLKVEDFGFPNEGDSEVRYQRLDDSTFLVFPGSSFLTDLGADTLFLPPSPLNYTFETSGHPCGFDTLIFEIGHVKEFMDPICEPRIFMDTLITYSPPGFPLLEISNAPTEIDYTQENEIQFSISNMGQGDIVLTHISFDQLPEADLSLILIDSLGMQSDITDALSREDSAVNVNFLDNPTMRGISKDKIEQYSFFLRMNNICPVTQFFATSIKATAQSHCGDIISSNISRLDQIPYIDTSEINYSIDHSTYVTQDYLERVHLELMLSSVDGTASPLTDASLQIHIPKDLSFIPGSILKNGQPIDDPDVDINDDNRILILNGLEVMDGDLFEITFDLQCTDRCIVNQISSYLLINRSTECNGSTSNRIINKSQPQVQDLYYYPKLEFEEIEISDLSIAGDKVSLRPQVSLLALGAEDRSNTGIATIYFDSNQNETLDPEENTILEIPRSEWVQIDSIITIFPLVEIEGIDICDLAIIINSPANCFNDPLPIPLSSEQNITLEQDIYYCGRDTVKVELADYPTCDVGYRNLDEQNVLNNVLYYPTSNNTGSDTIYRDIICGACLITEQYNLYNAEQQITINLDNNNCASSANVTWADGSPIPANYNIEWNNDPAFSSAEITDLSPAEKLLVKIDDGSGCTYADSITTPAMSAITYSADVQTFCDPDSLSNILIDASGIDPMNITWRDGPLTFTRSELSDAIYHYTIRDGNNCEVSDSVTVQKPTPIDFNLPESQNIPLGTSIELNPQNIDNEDWTWTWESNLELSCYDCPDPSLVFTELAEVSLIIAYDDCNSEYATTIRAANYDDYYSPNIFDPLSPDNNRFLILPNTSYDHYDMLIIDRWGNIVYNKQIDNWLEDNVGWDGTFRGQDVSPGVYFYSVKLTREADETEVTFNGDFLLVR